MTILCLILGDERAVEVVAYIEQDVAIIMMREKKQACMTTFVG